MSPICTSRHPVPAPAPTRPSGADTLDDMITVGFEKGHRVTLTLYKDAKWYSSKHPAPNTSGAGFEASADRVASDEEGICLTGFIRSYVFFDGLSRANHSVVILCPATGQHEARDGPEAFYVNGGAIKSFQR